MSEIHTVPNPLSTLFFLLRNVKLLNSTNTVFTSSSDCILTMTVPFQALNSAVEEKEPKTAPFAWHSAEASSQACGGRPLTRPAWCLATPQWWLAEELVWAEPWAMGINSESDGGSMGKEYMSILPIMQQLGSKYSSSLTPGNSMATPQEGKKN